MQLDWGMKREVFVILSCSNNFQVFKINYFDLKQNNVGFFLTILYSFY